MFPFAALMLRVPPANAVSPTEGSETLCSQWARTGLTPPRTLYHPTRPQAPQLGPEVRFATTAAALAFRWTTRIDTDAYPIQVGHSQSVSRKRSVTKVLINCMQVWVEGQTVIAFSNDDSVKQNGQPIICSVKNRNDRHKQRRGLFSLNGR